MNKLKNTAKPGEGGTSDFQNEFHIIRFKWSELNNNNKNHKANQKAGKYGPTDGKNNSTESSLEKALMADILPKF